MKSKDNSILTIINQYPDPRNSKGVRYKYSDLLLMIIYSILSGFHNAVEINEFVTMKQKYFKDLIGLEKVPSHDTFSRILNITNFDHLGEILTKWLSINYPDLFEKYGGMKVLHIDGKAVRAASAKSEGEYSVYLLNAMYEGQTISLTTKKIGKKENEQGAITEFLKLFNLEDTIVTIDAAGTTSPIINYINDNKGMYLMQVKENQKNLLSCINDEINRLENTYNENGESYFNELDEYVSISKNHGRLEKVKTKLIKNTYFIYEKLGLKSFYGTIARVGIFDKKVIKKQNGVDVETNTRTILITNYENITPQAMQSMKLSHWNIEMQHWILDVQLNEDRFTNRKDNAVINNSMLKRFILKIKDNEPAYKGISLKGFFAKNFSDLDFLSKILFRNDR